MDREVSTSVVLRDALLAPGALDLGDRQAREAFREQVLSDRLEGLVPDVGDDHLHAVASPGVGAPLVTSDAPPAATGRAAGPVDAPPISGAGMNCSGYPYMPCSTMSSPASSSSSVTRIPTVA